MTMKKLCLTLLVALALAAPVSAQTFLTNTTLSAAATADQRTLALTSATGVEVGGQLYIDWELVTVTAISSTTVTVNRFQRPAAHASGAVVFIATKAQSQTNFLTHNAAMRAGVCSSVASSTNSVALAGMTLPFVDVDTGDMYGCRRNGSSGSWVWNVTNVTGFNGAGSVPTAQ